MALRRCSRWCLASRLKVTRGRELCQSLPPRRFSSAALGTQAEAPGTATESNGEGSAGKPISPPWRVVAATCVQRFPTLSREMSDLELRYEEIKDVIRMERSRLSDFELEEQEYLKKKMEREKKALEEDLTEAAKVEGSEGFEELQEAREVELEAFHPAPRETEADRTNDIRSLERKLYKVLYLLVKKPRKEHAWQMPQGGLEENESLLETARRELTEECGSELSVDFLSPTPVAFHSYQHPLLPHSKCTGTKVFFLKAQYQRGKVEVDSEEVVDYAWVTKEEMKHYVSPDYYSAVAPALLD